MELYLGSWLRHNFFLDKIHRMICDSYPQESKIKTNRIIPFFLSIMFYINFFLYLESQKNKNKVMYTEFSLMSFLK